MKKRFVDFSKKDLSALGKLLEVKGTNGVRFSKLNNEQMMRAIKAKSDKTDLAHVPSVYQLVLFEIAAFLNKIDGVIEVAETIPAKKTVKKIAVDAPTKPAKAVSKPKAPEAPAEVEKQPENTSSVSSPTLAEKLAAFEDMHEMMGLDFKMSLLDRDDEKMVDVVIKESAKCAMPGDNFLDETWATLEAMGIGPKRMNPVIYKGQPGRRKIYAKTIQRVIKRYIKKQYDAKLPVVFDDLYFHLIAEFPEKDCFLLMTRIRNQIPARLTNDWGYKFECISPGHYMVLDVPASEKKFKNEYSK